MVKLFVEGGGDGGSLRRECRRGFAKFFERAGITGKPRTVACGSRNDAFDSFCTALEQGEPAMLLVDSEAPVPKTAQAGADASRWQPWLHLAQRDGWAQPAGSEDWQCHLMVQCMEAWLVADRATLKLFFGQGYRASALPKPGRALEWVDKQDLFAALGKTTAQCQKRAYSKGAHSFELLARLDPGNVVTALPWAARLVDTLKRQARP